MGEDTLDGFIQIVFRFRTRTHGWWTRLADAEHLTNMTGSLARTEIAALLDISGDPEGWFFPDTYQYAKGDTDIEILALAVSAMRRAIDELWLLRSEGVPLNSSYEAMILASVIEKETADPVDRPKVAGVFHNRLLQGMKLQSDPTVIYGLGADFDGDLKRSHLRADTPFNSYTRKGLPPTPICSPGRAAIKAAVTLTGHPYLYFVARGDGTSEFSITLAEHNAAVRQFQINPTRQSAPDSAT